MAWESRGGWRYYTRSRRVDGKVVREYVGGGAEGAEAAAADVQRRAQRKAQAQALRAEALQHAEAVAPLDDLCRLTDLLMEATLLSLNYHQHARGAWRRKRHDRDKNTVGGEGLPSRAAQGP